MIRSLDTMLLDWGEATRRLTAGELGFGGRSPLARIGEAPGTPYHRSRVLTVELPSRLLGLDRAIRDMPGVLKPPVAIRYLEGLDRDGQEAAWVARTHKGRRLYWSCLDNVHWWLAGRLGAS